MLTIKRTTQFKKDFKRLIKQGVDIQPLMEIIAQLSREELLDEKFHDHALKGELILTLSRTGSHSELFD